MVHVLENGRRLRVRLPRDVFRPDKAVRPIPEEIEVIRQAESGEYDPPIIFVPRDVAGE